MSIDFFVGKYIINTGRVLINFHNIVILSIFSILKNNYIGILLIVIRAMTIAKHIIIIITKYIIFV